ncbi:ferric-rhodotorulic acid/ferric-coprogen receptor FhuE [Variovorax sp. UMC13]|uniref:ferric-rhodotorulic acid/ferric-coprogen receptor FhuE n=1 Tax=Variovorax sp. UMC13 TaxID=1862326 RepID=UPI0016035E10|nr:porin [Variovorax sp. UMC13]
MSVRPSRAALAHFRFAAFPVALHRALLVLALGGAASAFAAGPVALESIAPRAYDLPAGPLGRTLSAFAAEAGVALSFDPALTDGRTGPALSGRYAGREAMAALLAGSGLEAVARDDGSYVLRRRAAALSSATTTGESLPTVTVSADADRSGTTEGTGSYTTRATAAATGLSLALRDTPQSVSVLTRQQIEDQNLVSLNEALRSVTGIHVVSSDSDRFDFYSRGFYIDNIQYDGVPTSLGLSFYGESGSDTTIYDRVEVVRGATGLLTGAGNPSASINLVRKRADSKVFTGSASLGVGSWNQHRAAVDLSTPITEDGRVRGRFAAMTEERDSHVDLYHARKNAFYAVVDADLTPATTLSVGADYQSNRPTGSTWGGLPLVFSDGSIADWPTSKTTAANWTHWNSTNRSVFANLAHRFDSGWSLKANLSHRESDYDAKLLYLFSQPDPVTGQGLRALPNYSEYSFQQNSADLQATGPFTLLGRTHEAVLGLTSSRAREVKAGHARTGALASTGDFRQWDGSFAEPSWGPLTISSLDRTRQDGLYGALRLSLADPLKLILGGRQSSWEVQGLSEARKHDVFTPYAGLVYEIDRTYSAYASYTDIFQPQNYRDTSGAYLDPVTGKSFELGLKGAHLGGRLNTSLAVFRIRQDNVAQLDGSQVVPGTTDFAYFGAKGVTSRGFEAQVSGEITPDWKLSAGLSRTVAEDAEGTAVNAWAPRTQVQLFSSYRLQGAWQALTLGGGFTWQSSTSSSFSTASADVVFRQKSFGLLNLMARYAFTPQLSLQLNLNNLADKKYYVNIDGQGQFGTPRSVMATLNYKF